LLVEKLQTVDAFVVFDLDDAAPSVGVVRSAPRILLDGATWLARSQTYQWASFERRVGGASAGVNAKPEGRQQAVESFVTEVQPWVAARRLVVDAGRGVERSALARLHDLDARPPDYWEDVDALAAVGIAASASVALGGLDGRTLAIEGFGDVGPHLADAVTEEGGRVVAISTSTGTVGRADGFEPQLLAESWSSHGDDLVRELHAAPEPPASIFGVSVDALVCGSRAGIIDHGVAAGCSAKAIVPSGPIPITAKALAVLHRAGVRVLPDFVTTAGPLVGGVAPALEGTAPPSSDEVRTAVGSVIAELIDHDEGPFLAACRRAEAFLGSWREVLPFGRPLA
jgi:glutamate dehydrogenase/leucine dehydrogenase